MKNFLLGAEKATAAALMGFITTGAAGYLVTQDWKGLLWGAAGAAATGFSTWLTGNTTEPTGRHEA